MKTGPLILTAAIILVAFSGCIIPLPGQEIPGSDKPAAIVKKVVATIDTENEPDSFEDVVKTRFEYRHEGADATAADVKVEYLHVDGTPRTRAITEFTDKTILREGDLVTIPDANFTSGLRVLRGDETLAERAGLDTEWFTAAGVPIPVSSTKEGVARYDVRSESLFEFDAKGFGDETTMVQSVRGKVKGIIEGTSRVQTVDTGAGPRLELTAKLKPDVDVLVEALLQEDGSSYEAGIRVYDDRGEFDFSGMMLFDSAHQLRKVGASSKQFFDAKVHVWDQEHPRSSNYEPEGIDHPMLDDTMPYEEETIDETEDMEAWLIEFLQRVWSMRVAVGDDYRLHAEHKGWGDENAGKLTFDYVLQIAGADSRTVGSAPMPTYRVSQVASLVVDPANGGSAEFDLLRSTYWISRDSYLPVYVQTKHSQSFNKEKVEAFFRFIGEDAPEDLPDSATLVLSDTTTISLEEYRGDLTIAPILGLLGANQGWMTGAIGAATVFTLVSDVGGYAAPAHPADPYETSPSISFTMDESQDRFTVTSATSKAEWQRLALKVRPMSTPGTTINVGDDLNGYSLFNEPAVAGGSYNNLDSYSTRQMSLEAAPVLAGDYVDLCASLPATAVTITVVDTWSNTILAEFTFSDVAIC